MMGENKPLYVSVFGHTDVGLVRENNEDSLLLADLTNDAVTLNASSLNHVVGEKGSLFVVADGMGGAEAGEVASRMAVELVSQQILRHVRRKVLLSRRAFVKALKKAAEYANMAIYRDSRNIESRRGMGTTLTAAGVYDAAIFFAQVGDSRGYLVRNGSITQMTKDQSLVANLVASGALSPDEAKQHPQRNVILQALGVQKHVNVVISFAELRRGDWAVLCSDGLSEKVGTEELEQELKKYSEPPEACDRMVALARERGGEDNITAIVAKFEGEGLPLPLGEERPVHQTFNEETRWYCWPWGRG